MNIISSIPTQNSFNASTIGSVSVLFDTDVNINTIDQSSITVSTKKASIFTVDTPIDLVDPAGVNNFFTSDHIGIVPGTVSIDSGNARLLVFKPDFKFQVSTEYEVFIAQGIAGTDGSLLSTVYTFKFTTAEEETAENLPDIPVSKVIIGTDVFFGDGYSTAADPNPYITRTFPLSGVSQYTGSTVKFYISGPVSVSKADIEVLQIDVFSDLIPEPVSDFSFNYDSTSGLLTLTLSPVPDNNSVIITLSKSIGMSKDYVLTFTSRLTPYYTTARLVKLKCGTLLTGVPDSTIALMILDASQDVDDFFSRTPGDHTKLKEKFVMFHTIESMLVSYGSSSGADKFKKQLAEFSISIDNSNKIKLYNALLKEANDFQDALMQWFNFARGGSFVKGSQSGHYKVGINRQWGSAGLIPGLNRVLDGKLVWDEIATPLPYYHTPMTMPYYYNPLERPE